MGDPMRFTLMSAALAALLAGLPAQATTLRGGPGGHGGYGDHDGGGFGGHSGFCSFGGGGRSCWNTGNHDDHDGPRFGGGFHPGHYNPPRKDEHCEDDPEDHQPPVVPLPAGLPLLLSGLGAVAALRRRARKAR